MGSLGSTGHLASRRFQLPSPFCPQGAWPLRIALVKKPGGRYPVGAEAPEVLAQLAPGDQMTDGLQIADRHRPDDTLAFAPLLIPIAQRDLPARVYLVAHTPHIEAVGSKVPCRRRFGRRLQHIR